MNKQKRNIFLSSLLLTFSVVASLCSTIAWFINNQKVDDSSNGISIIDSSKIEYEAMMYRSDDVGYNLKTSSGFTMLNYDKIIQENNLINNIVMAIEVSRMDSLTSTSYTIKAENTTPFLEEAVDTYYLSDAINISFLGDIEPLDLTNKNYTECYNIINESFISKAVTPLSFVTDDNGTYSKTDTLNFYSTKLISYFNISFNSTYSDYIYNLASNNTTIDKITDIKTFSLISALTLIIN